MHRWVISFVISVCGSDRLRRAERHIEKPRRHLFGNDTDSFERLQTGSLNGIVSCWQMETNMSEQLGRIEHVFFRV